MCSSFRLTKDWEMKKKKRDTKGKKTRKREQEDPPWQILLAHPAELCYKLGLLVAEALSGPSKEILQLMLELMPAGKSKLHLKGIYLFIF